MNRYLLSVIAISQWLLISQVDATSASAIVHGLSQGCYAIKSPSSQLYVHQSNNMGSTNSDHSPVFSAGPNVDASQYYFKPTRFNHFVLTDRTGRYLASQRRENKASVSNPEILKEWHVEAVSYGSGKYRFRLTSVAGKQILGFEQSNNRFRLFNLDSASSIKSESDLILEPKNDCTSFPEMEVNVTGDRSALKSSIDEPVRGFVDPHTHITAYEFMGGKFMHGKPFHELGVEKALGDSKVVHGPNGSLDLIGNLYAFNNINNRYDTRGWPDFPYWPNHKDLSHLGYYYKWIERAYLGGMRMMVTHLVENKVLCNVQSTVNPVGWVNANSCDPMDSIRLQAQRLYEMQDYIDAQAGGPGKGFFRLITSPLQARQVIADGKLAVLMGIEASELFTCGVRGGCTRHSVEQQLQEVYDLGVRGIFPTHKFDNKIAGSRVENGFINVGQWVSSGYLFDTEACPTDTKGARMEPGFPILGDIPVIGKIIDGIVNPPDYDPHILHCNQQGLTELGVYMVNRMIDMNMLIELDHAGEKSATSIMDIIEARGYSGVISSHGWLPDASDGGLHRNMKRLIQMGGFVAPYNKSTTRIANDISEYLNEVETTPYVHGVSFATDMSGLGGQAGPRGDASSNPLAYPFTSEFGLEFDRQVSGNRIMDYNLDGIAHFGMVADHLQDIREQASSRIYESIMNSTEAYLQMWERAESNRNSDYVNPLDLKVRVVNRLSGKCLDVPGEDNNVTSGQQIEQSKCDFKSSDQRWLYDSDEGTLRNGVDSSLCLDSREAKRRGKLLLRGCQQEAWAHWFYDGYSLRNKENNRYALAAAIMGKRVFMNRSRGFRNQQWELRSDREVYVWTTYRTAMGNGCLDVHNADTTNGNYLKLEGCHRHSAQEFYYNPKEGTVHSRLDFNKCVSLAGSNANSDTGIVIWDCNGAVNQQWDIDGGVFRSRLDNNKVIDVDGKKHGSRVSLKDFRNRVDQRWREVLQ